MHTPSIDTLDALEDALDYDPATGEIRWRVNTRRIVEGSLAGSIHRSGNLVIGFQGRTYQAHHIAWFLHMREWPTSQVLFRDGDLLNLTAANLYLQETRNTGSRNAYMRAYMRAYRASKRANTKGQRGTTRLPNVIYSSNRRAWDVRSPADNRIVLASFTELDDAEAFYSQCAAGLAFIDAHPPARHAPPVSETTAGNTGAITLGEAVERFAYDPLAGAIYRRAPYDHRGTPALELTDTRRPILKISGRTYSAAMFAWFLTYAYWPARRQIAYRDGNQRNISLSNLYLKGH